ncbi:MAG: mechanosensitive ion channel, partial [Muribaculaceae bacterium]|nr:mechanosensitive ion channel [Muribaculaceae bacterium]
RYLAAWLQADPRVNTDMTVMVRQLDPTTAGLPLQLYFFCHEVRWVEFEKIQSDIFDHIYAIIGEFGLRIFQSPSGADVREVRL